MKTLSEPAALFDEVNSLRKKVGLDPITLNEIASNTFHASATSYAFHLSLSNGMIATVGSLAMGLKFSLSVGKGSWATTRSCISRGLIQQNGERGLLAGFELTRVGRTVALMLEAGKFIELNKKQINALKERI